MSRPASIRRRTPDATSSPALDAPLYSRYASSPPLKGSPTLFSLLKGRRNSFSPPVGQDSDSELDYDDTLDDREVRSTDRGRTLPRQYGSDEILNCKTLDREATPENDGRSALVLDANELRWRQAVPEGKQPEHAASLAAVLNTKRSCVLTPPVMSLGLPTSPRPTNSRGRYLPLLSRSQTPLSLRLPQQPILQPRNNTFVTSFAVCSTGYSQPKRGSPLNVPTTRTVDTDEQSPTNEESNPFMRQLIHERPATNEHSGLLLPPSARPFVDIEVTSSRMKSSRDGLLFLNQREEDTIFTPTIASIADRGELWRRGKDASSLLKLDQCMKQCRAFTAKTPEKSLSKGHSPFKLDARRQALETDTAKLLDTHFDKSTALGSRKYLFTNTLLPDADKIGAVAKLATDPESQNIGPDGRGLRTGYLMRKDKDLGGWKIRFFVLGGPDLEYYEAPGGHHLGTIKLQGAQIGKQLKGGDNLLPVPSSSGKNFVNQCRHALLILEPKNMSASGYVKHVLCAEDDRERNDWIDALLQWVEPRGTDDTDGHPQRSDFRDRPHQYPTYTTKLKKHTQPRASSHRMEGSDPLIGVRYDSTNAGGAPQHANAQPKNAAGLSEQPGLQELAGFSNPRIFFGLGDIHLTSVAPAMGNKLGLPRPSITGEKQRERDFLGLERRTTSSSDDQEYLASSDSGALLSPGSVFPVRQIFGLPLAEAVRLHPPKDVDIPLPSIVYRCIQYLEANNALNEEGIFRLSGSKIAIKEVREKFKHHSDIDLVNDGHYYDIHAVASLLKLYLRELPSAILRRDLHLDLLKAADLTDRDEMVATMAHLIQRLPEVNLTLLKYLISFLIRIINNSHVNKMTPRNVCIIFSPTLNLSATVFVTFLQSFEEIFDTDPKEYKLLTASAVDPAPLRLTPAWPLAGGAAQTRQSLTSTTASQLLAYQPAFADHQSASILRGTGPRRPAYEPNYGWE